MKKAWLVCVVVVAALVSTAGAGAVTSGSSLDQYSYSNQGSSTVKPSYTGAQTFTVGSSGYLTDIMLMAGLPTPTTTSLPLRVAVVRVDGSGLPNRSSELAVQLVPSSAVASGGSSAKLDVTFSPPAHLTAGTKYAFVISSDDTTGYDLYGGGTSSYTRGQSYTETSSAGPWTTYGVGADSWFETYMADSLPDRYRSHGGYCAQTPTLRADGTVGVFLNLDTDQQLTDPLYRGATPAYYGSGYGLTCDALWSMGYTDAGYKVDGLGQHNGNDSDMYEYFTR